MNCTAELTGRQHQTLAKSRAITLLARVVPGVICNCPEVQYLRERVAELEEKLRLIREAV